MADLSVVYTFFQNADAHADFLHRVEAALVETALDIRAEVEPDPMTAIFVARQNWALSALHGPVYHAKEMLPGLAVKANEFDRISEEGVLTASDEEIRTFIAALVDEYSSYVPTI